MRDILITVFNKNRTPFLFSSIIISIHIFFIIIDSFSIVLPQKSIMTPNKNNSSIPHNDTISIDEVLCSHVQISTTAIEKIRQQTSKDVTLQHLKRIITDVWLETRI